MFYEPLTSGFVKTLRHFPVVYGKLSGPYLIYYKLVGYAMAFFLITVVLVCAGCGKKSINDCLFIGEKQTTKPIPVNFPDATTEREAWVKYLQQKLILDSAQIAAIPAGRYEVCIQFSIGQDGKINDVNIFKDPGYGLAQFAAGVVRDYKTEWRMDKELDPSGVSYQMQPFTFLIEEE